jgi:hypothetical protein
MIAGLWRGRNEPSPAWRERVASESEPGEGERTGRCCPATRPAHSPSPFRFAGPSLSRQAGAGMFRKSPMPEPNL